MASSSNGTVQLKRVTTTPGENEWDLPVQAVGTYDLAATVKRLHQRHEGGVLIVETGDMVTFAVPPVVSLTIDTLVIVWSGRSRT